MKKTHTDQHASVDEGQSQAGTPAHDTQHQSTGEGILPDAESQESTPVAKIEAELSDARDKFLRLYSEFENYKKRISRDRIEQTRQAGADVFLAILPVIDDLERAIKSIQETNNLDAVKEGVQLIYSKIRSITEARGLKAMDAVGKSFDPELHDAVTTIPAVSNDQSGKVVDEIEKGYLLNDRVLRHAKVIVAK